MNTIVVQVVAGKNRRLYPVGWVLPPRERNRAINLAHALVHGQHLSIRAAQAILLDQYALRRSVGQIHHDLGAFECPSCAEEAP